MSESVELEVYFKTDNKLPAQELQGVFDKYFYELSTVRRREKEDCVFDVTINELALLETTEDLLKVIKHCHKNHREISVEVTHGNIWRH